MDRGQVITAGEVQRPVRVEASLRVIRVAAVVPCFNRPEDLAALVGDLSRCELGSAEGGDCAQVELSVVVVDNASDPPIGWSGNELPGYIASGLLRLACNTGGSGGYNAGMAAALDAEPVYLWLVDSDARVEADTLIRLVAAMERDRAIVVAGPALADVETGDLQEVGGRFDRKTGRFGPMDTEAGDRDQPIECDYVAACCALVRADAVRRVGLMPDVFLNADDVEWCLRLARECYGRVVVLPDARAAHPRFDRFGTLPRYFGARNGFGPIDALGLGPLVRFRRAAREVMRAVNQHLMGRPDIAALHLRGLRDAARGMMRGLPADLPPVEPMRPFDELGEALRDGTPADGRGGLMLEWPGELAQADREIVNRALADAGYEINSAARAPTRSIAALVRRAITGPRFALAVVPAKGCPAHWLVGQVMVELAAGGFVIRREPRWRLVARCLGAVAAGGWLGVRIATRRRRPSSLPAVEDARRLAPVERATRAGDRRLGLSVVVLSYNRRDALLETLARLHAGSASRDAEIIVVDNASTDGSPEAVREQAPWARLVTLETNRAIAGFNRGVEDATGDIVLILDDDARPDQAALVDAMRLLTERADLAAVTLMPVHPATGASEWPFADDLPAARDDWPVMGCCNLVRRDVWRAVGGYDESFFLYRNDVELALKILATERGVHFNPAWRCEHDSPAAAQKSARWCELATRNWLWLVRRHGRGVPRVVGVLAGWAWAHRLAGLSVRRHLAVVRGGIAGLARRPAPRPSAVQPDGRAFAALLALRFGRRR